MTEEQHHTLVQLAQLGLQHLTEVANSALEEVRPKPPKTQPKRASKKAAAKPPSPV